VVKVTQREEYTAEEAEEEHQEHTHTLSH